MLFWTDLKSCILDSESIFKLWIWRSPCAELNVLPWIITFEEWAIVYSSEVGEKDSSESFYKYSYAQQYPDSKQSWASRLRWYLALLNPTVSYQTVVNRSMSEKLETSHHVCHCPIIFPPSTRGGNYPSARNLEKMIIYCREVLTLCPPGHLDHSSSFLLMWFLLVMSSWVGNYTWPWRMYFKQFMNVSSVTETRPKK